MWSTELDQQMIAVSLTVAKSFCVNFFSILACWMSLPTSSEIVSSAKSSWNLSFNLILWTHHFIHMTHSKFKCLMIVPRHRHTHSMVNRNYANIVFQMMALQSRTFNNSRHFATWKSTTCGCPIFGENY